MMYRFEICKGAQTDMVRGIIWRLCIRIHFHIRISVTFEDSLDAIHYAWYTPHRECFDQKVATTQTFALTSFSGATTFMKRFNLSLSYDS